VFSFVIPTLASRREDVRRCLAALRRECAEMDAEALLVVEDAAAARDLAGAAGPSFEVRLVERGGGAAARRNAAFRELRGEVVALIDDDAEPCEGYGAALRERFGRAGARPAVVEAIVQGAVWPAFDVEPPREILPVLFSVGGFNRHGERRREGVFISANCAFSREVLERTGPMREDLGPGGGGPGWGDDTEWHRRATAAGFPTAFDDRLAVRHRIQAERLTADYVISRAERVGRTLARLEWDARRPGGGVLLRQRILAAWARLRGGGIEARCLARRLAGYADELAVIRGR
jgi:GT2 family glycosyltransferase